MIIKFAIEAEQPMTETHLYQWLNQKEHVNLSLGRPLDVVHDYITQGLGIDMPALGQPSEHTVDPEQLTWAVEVVRHHFRNVHAPRLTKEYADRDKSLQQAV